MSRTRVISLAIVGLLALASAAYFVMGRPGGPGTAITKGDSPHPCDLQAAHPADIQRLATGKAENEIVPMLAVRDCTSAASQFPSEARFQFQLGRALLAMNRHEEATKAFNTAVSMGYTAANFYLAEDKLNSYWESESESELEEVRALLKAAAPFPPAAERLGQITFIPNTFSSPVLMQALWDGDYQSLNRARMLTALYAKGLHDSLAMEFHPSSQDCPAYVVDPSITFNLDRAIAGDPRNTIEGGLYSLAVKGAEYAGTLVWDPVWKGAPDKWAEYYQGLGKRDGLFLAHHQGCDSPVTARLYRNLVEFSKVQRPLSEYVEGMLRGDAKDLFSKPEEIAEK